MSKNTKKNSRKKGSINSNKPWFKPKGKKTLLQTQINTVANEVNPVLTTAVAVTDSSLSSVINNLSTVWSSLSTIDAEVDGAAFVSLSTANALLSTTTSTGLSSANSNIGSLSTTTSTGLSSANSNINSLSTTTSSGLSSTLSSANSNIDSLSTTTSSGLSSTLSSANSNIGSLSTTTSTALSTANSNVASLSTALFNTNMDIMVLASEEIGVVGGAGGVNNVMTGYTGGVPPYGDPVALGLTAIGSLTYQGNTLYAVNPTSLFSISDRTWMDGTNSSGNASGGWSMVGGNQEDTILGNAGNDTIVAGVGNDSIVGGGGADSIVAGNGNDTIVFATAASFGSAVAVNGGAGSNSVVLTTDAQVVADADFDQITASTIQSLTTANGANTVTLGTTAATAGIATVTGGSGADVFNQGTAAGTMTLIGGGADDTFNIETAALFAADSLDGGAGTNSAVLTTNAQTVVDADFDRIVAGTIDSLTTANGANTVTLGTTAALAGIATVTGGTGADSFSASGYTGAVTLLGGNGDAQSGADTLIGGAVNDWLQGWTNTTASENASNDTLTGGAGVDTFVLGNAGSNGYGQFNAVNPSNKYAQITDYNVTDGDLLRVWSNDFDVATFVNNGTDTITLTKTALAGAGNAYTLQYSQAGPTGTADLYMNGTNRLVASMSYTGDMTVATIGIFDLA